MKKLERLPEINGKKDLAFQLVVAMRDTINIAKKKGHKSTYENAIRLFNDFSPELYDDIITQLPQRNLSDEAKVYIAQAKLLSTENGEEISPLDLVIEEIDKFKHLQSLNDGTNTDQIKVIKNKIGSLEALKKSLKPRELSENRILNHDISRENRGDFGAKFLQENDFYVDYDLGNDKFLRIRLLHPDKPEHITGADLIYEQHNEVDGMIRVLFLQYKIWENGVLYFSQGNIDAQINKMKSCLCDNKYCMGPEFEGGEMDYRFPYCSAFLRPTDRLQHENEKLISTGIHIPICTIERLKKFNGNKLEKKHLKTQTLTHEIFEHLFNRGFIGSRWMNEQELEEFYTSHSILQQNDSIVFYAREIKEEAKSETPY